jgi:hypothetical protein
MSDALALRQPEAVQAGSGVDFLHTTRSTVASNATHGIAIRNDWLTCAP